MNAPGTIPRRRRTPPSAAPDAGLDFDRLRAEGLRLSQALSGHIWTDYNLHDPGVTLLEQLCYALTDLVYRVDFPVADHLLAPGATSIAYADLSLHPPHDVLPCRATSAADYRRVLLDQVPGLDDATLADASRQEGAAAPSTPPRGLHRLRLKLAQGLVNGEDARLAGARAAYRAQRTLCEDIDGRVDLIADVLCDLRIDVELAGPRDAADVLADIYARCAHHMARTLDFHGLDDLLARGLTLEQAYTGPITGQGFATDDDGPEAEVLFASDLAALVRDVEGVQDVRSLSLQRDGDAASSGALRWRGPSWALRLRVPGVTPDARTPEAVRALLARCVTLRRRGSTLAVAPADLAHRLADLHGASRTRRRGAAAIESVAMPAGRPREPAPYFSLQNDLPAIYGVGRHGLPPSATAAEKAQALQLKGYLAMFEQVLANGAAQVDHLRDLYSANDVHGPSYWWHMLDDRAVPGLDALYLPPRGAAAAADPAQVRAQVQAEVYESRDPRADRRSRALDHLLALHGESCGQNSLRQFLDYLDPAELESTLLENKAAFLRDILAISRDRAAGFDYSRPTWEVPGSGTGLQRRVSHLLGFRHAHSRSLVRAFQRQRRTPCAVGEDGSLGALDHVGPTRALRPHRAALTPDDLRADLPALRPLQGERLGEAVLRCGLYRDRYRLLGDPQDQAGPPGQDVPAGPHRLVLGPDERQRWWPLGEFDSPEAAARAAASMRHFLLHLSLESEGVHLVEHLLLRPVGDGAAHARLKGLPDDFHALRLTAVFPDWTARCAQPNFRDLAEETLRINCPAHVSVRCLWLAPSAMQRFEASLSRWLQEKVAFCQGTASAPDEALADPAAAERLDRAACHVIESLRDAWAPASGAAHG